MLPTRAYGKILGITGEDSSLTIRMAKLAANAAEHRFYRTSVKWEQSKEMVTSVLSDDEFKE